MFENLSFDGHEQVSFVRDEKSGLEAIIAIHSTALGPAAGGCRLWSYQTPGLAAEDALRLSRGMSFKNALAGLPMGGGKAVILGPIDVAERRGVFEAFGEAVDALGGRYITAEDVGVRVEDMHAVASKTEFVSGLTDLNGAGGDPSPYTARGVRRAIDAVSVHGLGRTSLAGVRIAVQGLGGVGGNLCQELAERGAELVVADINRHRVEEMCDCFGATPGHVDTILFEDVDIVSPCALGGVLTAQSVQRIRASAVVGGANNQLSAPQVGHILFDRSIIYAPDYLVNAGGIIMVAAEYFRENDQANVNDAVDRIYDRTLEILLLSKERRQPTSFIADAMAQNLISEAQKRAARTSIAAIPETA